MTRKYIIARNKKNWFYKNVNSCKLIYRILIKTQSVSCRIVDFKMYTGFPHSSVGKEFTCDAGNPGVIPGSGRSAAEGISYWFQYSRASLVAQLVKNPPAMWDTWVRSLGQKGKIPWRSKRLLTPVFWPGEFHGLCCPWSRKQSDTTEWLSLSQFIWTGFL